VKILKVGEAIKRARLGMDLSRRELSLLTGIDPQHIYRIETGRRTGTIATLSKIAKVLKIKIVI
jgi:transcriptional regulator with XRE-family HTH domain